MASVLNTILNYTGAKDSVVPTPWGAWEDVDMYESVIIVIDTGVSGALQLQWGNTDRGAISSADVGIAGNDVIAVEDIPVLASLVGAPQTFTRDHRGRWFRIKFKLDALATAGRPLNISVNYKTFSSRMKIGSDSAITTIGGTTGNYAFRTVYSDASGLILKNTGSATGNALNTTLRDNTGTSMSFTADGRSLITAISDASGLVISNANHTAFGTMSNSVGVSQATTGTLNGTSTAGVANFLALSDGVGSTVTSFRTLDKTTYTGNSVYTTLCTSGGLINSATNPLWLDISADPMEGIRAFDFSTGITTTLRTVDQFTDHNVNLFNLFIYNDGPVTAWIKIYDMQGAEATGLTPTAVLTVRKSTTIAQAVYTFTSDVNAKNLTGAISQGTSTSALASFSIGRPSILDTTLITFTYYTANGGYWLATSPQGGPALPTTGIRVFTDRAAIGVANQNRVLYVAPDPTITAPESSAFKLKDEAGVTVTFTLDNNTTIPFYWNTKSYLIGNFGTTPIYISDLAVNTGSTGYTDGEANVIYNTASVTGGAVIPITITARQGTDKSPYVIQNIACGAKSMREIMYPGGLELKNGLYIRCTLEQGYNSNIGPAANQVFVNGLYVNYAV